MTGPSRLNLRDLGGHVTVDGRTVRSGLLFRSGEPRDLSEEDRDRLAALRLRTVIDLRTEFERTTRETSPVEGVVTTSFDVLGPDAEAGPAHLNELIADPPAARRQLGEGRAAEVFAQTYRDFVSADPAQRAYRNLLVAVVAAEGPLLFHCTAGKDRTGWAGALILSLLGVPYDDVMRDYLATNESFARFYAPFRGDYERAGGDLTVLDAVLNAMPAYLEAAYDEIAKVHQNLDGYVRDGLGLDPDETRAALRRRLLEP